MPVKKGSVSTDWRIPGQRKAEPKRERRFRIQRGAPDEIWIVSFCETHGFTEAKYLRAAEGDQTIFKGDCGCEILHGDFILQTNDGRMVKLKVKPVSST